MRNRTQQQARDIGAGGRSPREAAVVAGDPHPIFTELARGDLSEGVAEYLAGSPVSWYEPAPDAEAGVLA